MPDGVWTIPEDYLDKAAEFEGRRQGRASLSVRSWLSLEQQIEREGVTWLDDVAGGAQGKRLVGARQARLDWLRQQGWLAPDEETPGEEVRSRLLRREREMAAVRITKASGRVEVALQTGETISGRYERAVSLGSGRFAVIGNAKAFALVPWRAEIERHRGRELVAKRTAQGLSWTIGMGRKKGLSR